MVEAEVYILNKIAEDWWIDEDGIKYTFNDLSYKYGTCNVKYGGRFYWTSRAFIEPPLTWFLSEEIINQTPKIIGGTAVGWIAFGVVVAYVKQTSNNEEP